MRCFSNYCEEAMTPNFLFFRFLNRRDFILEFGTLSKSEKYIVANLSRKRVKINGYHKPEDSNVVLILIT